MAGSLLFTSCWVFGESLPLKTAGPLAAVCEGRSETGPEQRGSVTEEVSSWDALSPASRNLLFFHSPKRAFL